MGGGKALLMPVKKWETIWNELDAHNLRSHCSWRDSSAAESTGWTSREPGSINSTYMAARNLSVTPVIRWLKLFSSHQEHQTHTYRHTYKNIHTCTYNTSKTHIHIKFLKIIHTYIYIIVCVWSQPKQPSNPTLQLCRKKKRMPIYSHKKSCLLSVRSQSSSRQWWHLQADLWVQGQSLVYIQGYTEKLLPSPPK